jgi:hypothetical protein
MIPKLKVTVIDPWTEIDGPFIRLEEREGELLAEIAEHIVVLPLELKDALTPLMGHRIAMLRTDIPGRDYLFRVLPENNQESGREITPMNIGGLCENERMLNCDEVI